MRAVVVTAGSYNSTLSNAVVTNQYVTPFNVLLAVELFGGTGGSYTVQYSPDDPFATYATDYNTNANWYNHPTLVNLSADGIDQFSIPVRGVRLQTNTAATGATATPRLVVNSAGEF